MSEKPAAPQFRTLEFAQPTQCRRYDGRVAVVTGAAQGLGRVIAKRLAEEGAKLVVCDMQEDRLAVAARELREETGMPFLVQIADPDPLWGRCGAPYHCRPDLRPRPRNGAIRGIWRVVPREGPAQAGPRPGPRDTPHR